MNTLLTLIAVLSLAQWLCARRARGTLSRMMRPADDWDGDDTDRWLALIEPFPLPDPTGKR